MTAFYKHLYSGEQKDEAVRNAKLDYLNNDETTRFVSHPFYWAAFVQLGDNRAMFEKRTYFDLMWLYGLGVLLILSIVGVWKKW